MCITAKQSKERTEMESLFPSLLPPASNDLPGHVVSRLYSLVEGKNFCLQWGSMRVTEKRRRRDPRMYNIRFSVWRGFHLSGEGS